MTLPKKMQAGTVLGAIGGVICIALLAYYFEPNTDYAAAMGACLLLSAMFFGLSGAFTANGQWSWEMLMIMTFATAGTVAFFAILGFIGVLAMTALLVISALMAVALMFPSSKMWMERTKI